MAAMKELLLEELDQIDQRFGKDICDYYSFSLGMLAMTAVLEMRTDKGDESQAYMLSELKAVSNMWIDSKAPK